MRRAQAAASSGEKLAVTRVLYATDFSEAAMASLPFALSLARRPGGNVLVVHVVSMGPLPAGFPSREWLAARAQAVRESRERMKEMQEKLQGVEYRTLVRSGDPCGEICAIARGEPIDAIIVGTHGRKGLGKVVLGSVAERLFRHAPCPVLTVNPGVRSEAESVTRLHGILFPTDFSPAAVAALPYAVELAREHGARLYLLHAAEASSEQDRAAVAERLRNLVAGETGLGCEPKARVETGPAAQAILDVADELAIDLIVMGVRRHAALPGMMATAYRVVRQAGCPVFTVHS